MEIANDGGENPEKRHKRGHTPGRRRRTPLEIARDRAFIEKRRLRYKETLTEISAKLNATFYDSEETQDGKLPPHISPRQIKTELDAALDAYDELTLETIQAERKLLIREYEDLAKQCQERYDASCSDKITKVKESRSNSERGDSELEREQTQNTDGNPTYLLIKKQCLDMVTNLKNVLLPRKVALTNPEGTESFKGFDRPEELKRLDALAKVLLPKMQEAAKIPAKEGLN